MRTFCTSLSAALVVTCFVPMAKAQEASPANEYYAESWKQGNTKIRAQRIAIRIGPGSPRKKTSVKDASGIDKYALAVSSDSDGLAWYVELVEKGHERFGNLLRPHNDPHQDFFMPLDGISLILYQPPTDEPVPILSVPFESTRIIKVENFYCIIRIRDMKLSMDRRKLKSALVDISLSNNRPTLVETESSRYHRDP